MGNRSQRIREQEVSCGRLYTLEMGQYKLERNLNNLALTIRQLKETINNLQEQMERQVVQVENQSSITGHVNANNEFLYNKRLTPFTSTPKRKRRPQSCINYAAVQV